MTGTLHDVDIPNQGPGVRDDDYPGGAVHDIPNQVPGVCDDDYPGGALHDASQTQEGRGPCGQRTVRGILQSKLKVLFWGFLISV